MADSNEPKKETVRISVSPQPAAPAAATGRETVRIHLPSRPPTNQPAAPTESPTASGSVAAAAAAAMPSSVPAASPKKETARITVLPDPPAKPAVQMKKTQPLIDLPAMEKPVAAVKVTPQPAPQLRIDNIPMGLCWALFGISVAILILQIWNYLS